MQWVVLVSPFSFLPSLFPSVFQESLWIMYSESVLSQHVEVLRIYVLSPFLYGHAHQSDRWLKWCHEAGLLRSDM